MSRACPKWTVSLPASYSKRWFCTATIGGHAELPIGNAPVTWQSNKARKKISEKNCSHERRLESPMTTSDWWEQPSLSHMWAISDCVRHWCHEKILTCENLQLHPAFLSHCNCSIILVFWLGGGKPPLEILEDMIFFPVWFPLHYGVILLWSIFP